MVDMTDRDAMVVGERRPVRTGGTDGRGSSRNVEKGAGVTEQVCVDTFPVTVTDRLDGIRRQLKAADWKLLGDARHGCDIEGAEFFRQLAFDARCWVALHWGHLPVDVVMENVKREVAPGARRNDLERVLVTPSTRDQPTLSDLHTVFAMSADGATNKQITDTLARGRWFCEQTLPGLRNWLGLARERHRMRALTAVCAANAGVDFRTWWQWACPDAPRRTASYWYAQAPDVVADTELEVWTKEDPDILLGYLYGEFGEPVMGWADERGMDVLVDVSRLGSVDPVEVGAW